jgi:hypothetical protein
MTKLKRVGCIKEPVLGSTAIFLLKDQENSKLYRLVVSYRKPELFCLEWYDGIKQYFIGCVNLNLLVQPSVIEKCIMKMVSEKLGTEFADAVKQLIDSKEMNSFDEIENTLESHTRKLGWLVTEEI